MVQARVGVPLARRPGLEPPPLLRRQSLDSYPGGARARAERRRALVFVPTQPQPGSAQAALAPRAIPANHLGPDRLRLALGASDLLLGISVFGRSDMGLGILEEQRPSDCGCGRRFARERRSGLPRLGRLALGPRASERVA